MNEKDNTNPFALIWSTIILFFSFISGIARREILVGAHCLLLKDNVTATEYVSISRHEMRLPTPFQVFGQ
jgi:hypothetical protein